MGRVPRDRQETGGRPIVCLSCSLNLSKIVTMGEECRGLGHAETVEAERSRDNLTALAEDIEDRLNALYAQIRLREERDG